MTPDAARLETLATSTATRSQAWFAGLFCLATLLGSLLLLPSVARPMPPMPGFLVLSQTALILVYGLSGYLFLAQYAQTRSVPLLILAAGGLFTTGMVLVQLLCFPNVLAPGLLMGAGPDTLTWLWTFWHLGPPLFALPYAIMEGDGRARTVSRRWMVGAGALAVLGSAGAVGALGWLVVRHVDVLPKSVQGDDYWLLTTSGIGPTVELLTMLSLAVLYWTTKLRTVLQLWLAASLFLLVLDNLVTDLGAARASLGWLEGRVYAVVAGLTVLAVYLRELDALRRRGEVISAEREAERASAQSAGDSLTLALEATGLCDWELDLATDTCRRKPAHDQVFGHATLLPRWGRAELLSHVVPEDRRAASDAFEAAIGDGRLHFEVRIKRADTGVVRWVSVLGKTYYDPAGRPSRMAGCVMDSTERRQTEERLRRAERMEAVGQLTGGVAHDFNNILTVITGSLELMSRRPGDAARVERFATGALAAARRGAEVTGKLLAFSSRQVVRPEVTNLNRLLQEFLPLMRQAASEQVPVVLNLDAALDPARIDPRQFEAALLNLLANARDAMPSGGQVSITTRNVDVPNRGCHSDSLPAGPYLQVEIADSGFGMDVGTARAAFEPFFTTKEIGKGTGLGLSQVYGFAKQAGGIASIESVVGQGTTVTLWLPRALGEEQSNTPSPNQVMALRPANKGEVVLVVEDDPAVLELSVESLHDLGYKTLTANTAANALERLRGSERIDLLFSDIVMPGGMNGVQLAVVARTIRDGLKVVLTSGYTASALAADHELPPGTPLLSKPYARTELAQTLQTLLMGS